MLKNGEIKICKTCGKEWYVSGYRKQSALCCSPNCLYKLRAVNKEKCLAGEPIFCEKHGLHTKWYYKSGNSNTMCMLCKNEKQLESYKDPNRKFSHLLNNARHRAKKYNRSFDLDKEFLQELLIEQNNKCAMSGIDFISNDKNFEMSIDRIDSAGGYTRDNVHIVLIVVNIMKMHHSTEMIIDICTKIAEFNKEKNKNELDRRNIKS